MRAEYDFNRARVNASAMLATVPPRRDRVAIHHVDAADMLECVRVVAARARAIGGCSPARGVRL